MMTENDIEFSGQLYGQLARISKAMASPRRLELVDLLAQGERTVEDLAALTAMSVANTSRHLQSLRAARLVTVRREGLYAHYRLADAGVFRLWQAVRDLGEARLAGVRELVRARFEPRGARGGLDLAELRRRLESGEAIVLDARPEREFRAGHIPGALSLPIEDLDAHLHVLPADQEIVVYSRGPYCGMADQAVAILEANGYRARRLAQGFPDWRAAGHPVAVDSHDARS
ncbi:MAG: metalloregulator ArsR/SmtB family transcription factor [Candidatus Eisenbacteria bacterium]|uniref:Metalloregulator ArsR/SmtB family transcription factor n=1 Tax=Eiseniibacteriota bacterium TaxID=2212470 RepID=A0A538UDC7_UNCEI|nr:MAG: metalloregulator ArsR/SmtB family transcription factor [Candidatus Eisenbacteria bacterium]